MFRDIKRDAFHRSHPLVPAMNASTTPSPPSPSPVSLPFRAHVHTHTHTASWRQTTPTRELWRGSGLLDQSWLPSPPRSPPFDGYTPNLQLSPSHHHEHAIYYTPGDRMRGRLSVTRVCSRIKLLRTIYRCHRYTEHGDGCRVYLRVQF